MFRTSYRSLSSGAGQGLSRDGVRMSVPVLSGVLRPGPGVSCCGRCLGLVWSMGVVLVRTVHVHVLVFLLLVGVGPL